jgi:hypothetical protein
MVISIAAQDVDSFHRRKIKLNEYPAIYQNKSVLFSGNTARNGKIFISAPKCLRKFHIITIIPIVNNSFSEGKISYVKQGGISCPVAKHSTKLP